MKTEMNKKSIAFLLGVIILMSAVSCSLLPGEKIKEPYVCIRLDASDVVSVSFRGASTMNADNSVIKKGTLLYFSYPDLTTDFDALITLKMADGRVKETTTHMIKPNGANYNLSVSIAPDGKLQVETPIDDTMR